MVVDDRVEHGDRDVFKGRSCSEVSRWEVGGTLPWKGYQCEAVFKRRG